MRKGSVGFQKDLKTVPRGKVALTNNPKVPHRDTLGFCLIMSIQMPRGEISTALPLEVAVGQCLQRGKDRASEDPDFSPWGLKPGSMTLPHPSHHSSHWTRL